LCNILPATHALTGCDSVSSFHGIGKRSVMRTVSKNDGKEYEDLASLGTNSIEDSLQAARKLIVKLYSTGKKKKCPDNLNTMRAEMAKGNTSVARLPPSETSFYHHVKRAAWQTRVWMTSGEAEAEIGSCIGEGWRWEDETVVPVFFDGPTASELLTGLICSCTGRNKCSRDCSCTKGGLICTDLCSCGDGVGCGNPIRQRDPEDMAEESP
jgi:hypothetical protein